MIPKRKQKKKDTTQRPCLKIYTYFAIFQLMHTLYSGPGSVAGMATGDGLGGTGIESRWGEIFRTCPDRPWGPPSLQYNGYRVFPGGKERSGRDADPSSPSSAVGHERVELYLYSPYRPYGLYRASVPVQGCTLTFYTLYIQGVTGGRDKTSGECSLC